MKKIIFLFLAFGFFRIQAQTPVLVKTFATSGGFIYDINVINNKLMFTFSNVNELWTSDGTDVGTKFFSTIQYSSSVDALPYLITNGKLFYQRRGADFSGIYQIWKTDLTDSGTSLVYEYNIANIGLVRTMAYMNGFLYFFTYGSASSSNNGQLWKLNVSSIVPIHLLTFTGKPLNNQTQLDWQTETEINASRIDIDRSTDGQTWAKLGSVNAKNQPSNYQYIDQNPKPTEVNYYRLCMVDIDGKKEFSKIVSVKMSEARSPIKIYPSITEGSILIETALNIQQVWVSNASGQIVLISTQSTLNLGTFPTGIYMITVKADNSIFSETVFKK
jgi:hypothetical protein